MAALPAGAHGFEYGAVEMASRGERSVAAGADLVLMDITMPVCTG
jgi:YesN/AraC family two-component response regulator